MRITEALSQLDSMDDEHWTEDGVPKVEKVSELMGEKVTRRQIVDAAPHFNRSNMELEEEDAEEGKEEGEEVFLKYQEIDPDDGARIYKFILQTKSEDLEKLSNLMQSQMDELMKTMRHSKEMYEIVRDARNMVEQRIDREVPRKTEAQKLREHHLRQNARRMKAGVEAAKQERPKLPEDVRAPIDRAFARKNARGVQRPKRKLL